MSARIDLIGTLYPCNRTTLIVRAHATTTPAGFDYAYLQRRVNAGTWYTLNDDGTWSNPATSAKHFVWSDMVGKSFIVQDLDLANGCYEYRWTAVDGVDEYTYDCDSNYRGPEYLDTPNITGMTVLSVSGRAVKVSVSVDSGDASGNVEDHVACVRIWNDGETESLSPWQFFTSGTYYPHTLTAGSGVKTVKARVMHWSGHTSDAFSATVTCVDSVPVTPDFDFENVLIAHGSPTHCFTGDKNGRVSSDEEDADYPAEAVASFDLSYPFKTVNTGGSDTRQPWGFSEEHGAPIVRYYASWLKWDLAASTQIDLVAILAHNFSAMQNQAEACGGTAKITLFASDTSDDFPNDASLWYVDLSAHLERDTIVHRPQVSRRYWGLCLQMYALDPDLADSYNFGLPWSIGRVILNETSQCWQPGANFNRVYTTGAKDPSRVTTTEGGAEHVIEEDSKRYVVLEWDFMDTADHEALSGIWELHRAIRPLFLVLQPERVKTDDTEPESDDLVPYTLYGKCESEHKTRHNVNDLGEVSVRFNEVIG